MKPRCLRCNGTGLALVSSGLVCLDCINQTKIVPTEAYRDLLVDGSQLSFRGIPQIGQANVRIAGAMLHAYANGLALPQRSHADDLRGGPTFCEGQQELFDAEDFEPPGPQPRLF